MTKCMFEGCHEEALPEPVGRGRLALRPFVPAGEVPLEEIEVDIRVCEGHVEWLCRGALADVSIAVKPRPARPA